jgi:hypothetical protein
MTNAMESGKEQQMKKFGGFLLFLGAVLLCLPAGATAFQVGDLSVGGAIRANYTIGDYVEAEPSRPSRAEDDGGNFALDTFRINLDYAKDKLVGKLEYRFYNGYHFLHTGWLGYNLTQQSQVQVGVNRVPFGPGPYGVSQSWMFDQHYYVGLSDDMDLGVKYTKNMDRLTLDFAYYVMDEGDYFGGSEDSARYSYDVVDETEDGYEEEHQFNVRAIYTIEGDALTTDLGASLQYGMLGSNGPQDDGEHYAGSVHAIMQMGNWKLAPQLTYYEYDVEEGQPLGDDRLVYMGAYDYRTQVAAEACIPAVSLSYYLETPQVDFLKYVIPYIEYSSIMKEESDFNDSDMFVLGAAWANKGWYIYTDLAYSNGNDFVGNESGWSRFGANQDDEWEYRFNINFGYYF